ncbi:MAG: hypothetical protein QOK29_3272 [Rhodospirillaceae bacterium]|jgi:hypothetical protein|nr:hypothetical protein [Rhodospirillaceae bacterium]
MPDKSHRLLVIFRFKDYSVARLANLVPALAALLAEMSLAKPELAFHSHARDLIGYFIVTRLAAERVRAAIESSGRVPPAEWESTVRFSEGSDSVMVLGMSGPVLAGRGLVGKSKSPAR